MLLFFSRVGIEIIPMKMMLRYVTLPSSKRFMLAIKLLDYE